MNARLPPPVASEASMARRLYRGTGKTWSAGLHLVLFAGRKRRLGQLDTAGQPGAGQVVIVLDEDRVERQVACPPSPAWKVVFFFPSLRG